jgi:hypothetical protein
MLGLLIVGIIAGVGTLAAAGVTIVAAATD